MGEEKVELRPYDEESTEVYSSQEGKAEVGIRSISRRLFTGVLASVTVLLVLIITHSYFLIVFRHNIFVLDWGLLIGFVVFVPLLVYGGLLYGSLLISRIDSKLSIIVGSVLAPALFIYLLLVGVTIVLKTSSNVYVSYIASVFDRALPVIALVALFAYLTLNEKNLKISGVDSLADALLIAATILALRVFAPAEMYLMGVWPLTLMLVVAIVFGVVKLLLDLLGVDLTLLNKLEGGAVLLSITSGFAISLPLLSHSILYYISLILYVITMILLIYEIILVYKYLRHRL